MLQSLITSRAQPRPPFVFGLSLTMLTMRALYRSAVAAGTLSLAGLSGPAAADDGGLYVGANVGTTLSTYSRSDLNNALGAAFNGELSLSSSSVHKPSTIWSVDFGYMASPYFGVEASYIDLETLKYHAEGTQSTFVGESPVYVQLDINSRGPALVVLGALPLWNAWRVDARAGVYLGKTTSEYISDIGTNQNVGSQSSTTGSLLLGVGGSYSFAGHWAVRLDYLYINGVHEKVLDNKFNVSLLTAGFIYAF